MSPGKDTATPIPGVKRRIRRSTTACLPCRHRKRKCGKSPPSSCDNCLQDGITCEWPTVDGRKIRFHRPKRETSTSNEPRDRSASPKGGPGPSSTHLRADNSAIVDDTYTHSFHGHSTQSYSSHHVGLYPDVVPLPIGSSDESFAFPAPFNLEQSVEQIPLPHLDAAWSSQMDPVDLVSALSSQMPIIESSSPDYTGRSVADLFSSFAFPQSGVFDTRQVDQASPSQEQKCFNVTWWRPHGDTAIAPGLKRITLKVRVEPPRKTSPGTTEDWMEKAPEVLMPNGMPSLMIMDHLLDLFDTYFGCQFPALEKDTLKEDIHRGGGSIFLLNCIACSAARFSTHPWIALEHLQPHEYGNVFLKVARDLMGSMLSVPSRDTVNALALLAGISHGIDDEAAEWMTTGMAVRMALDLGLHLDHHDVSSISPNDQRLNKLTFWTVFMLDFSLSFGVGRISTFQIKGIKQSLPTDQDMVGVNKPAPHCRTAFPYAAAQMLSYGSYIDILNGPHDESDGDWLSEARLSIRRSVVKYNSLPPDMQWNATNFQNQSAANQGSIFVQMHLWMHTLIASAYLTDTSQRGPVQTNWVYDAPPLLAPDAWRHSARIIGDILVLSDIINPFAYHALPFVNQAFFVAGCCYIKEVENQQRKRLHRSGTTSLNEVAEASRSNHEPIGSVQDNDELYHNLLTLVTSRNINTLQRGLDKQAKYWSGVAWVAQALEQRLSGVSSRAIDLVAVTEQLASYVSIRDAGIVESMKKEV
ncbi:hypothetical protein DB88DRAFT_513497 [Papiliotrema laurentii]|uniref:Zn(2)-C6 fungal-type domain-containing protein n=1 Tax=Papiliotrema laurentii TaxID=5418 RepID=A0AAD9FM53_PAPLA|nr:hypothetical protein DB88DRAFT_513497 [Papiliotrema laurentii]